MKKIFFVLVALIMLGCSQQYVTNAPEQENNVIEENKISSASNEILIQSFAFKPDVLTIKKGESVTWINKDPVKHSVTSDDALFESELLPQGQSYVKTFDEIGTFSYHCTPHPSMNGKIIVE